MGKILSLILIALFFSGCGTVKTKIVVTSTPSATIFAEAKSTLVLDFGDGKVATYSNVLAKNAYEALVIATAENDISLNSKEYDFGILVESIGDKKNTKDLAWIYYVNGKSAEVGADKYELKDGDVVEWKYIKPNF